jgi:hypothetical protein
MRAWHRSSLRDLVAADPTALAAKLAAAAATRRLGANPESMSAWVGTVQSLQRVASDLIARERGASDWYCFLEFEVPRRSRRIDTLILADDLIFLVEWKVGASAFDRAAYWQAEQYALDLRDFHEGSRERYIVPIVLATDADVPVHQPVPNVPFDGSRPVQPVQTSTPGRLAELILGWYRASDHHRGGPLDPVAWENSQYRPTPTIVEAASLLYEGHDVRDLSLSGASNLDETVAAVLELIDRCRIEQRHGVAFITGAPGSGKTLAGLQIVHAPEMLRGSEAAGVFLSGNMPLVEVITAALAESAARSGMTKARALREVKTFIQHAYQFRNESLKFEDRPPHEHVILFDEAQRAWDAAQVSRWTRGGTTRSEPELFLDFMARFPDWSVVIALVGSGQEINSGEAGLGEWGRAIVESHPGALVIASPDVLPGRPAPPGGRLFDVLPGGVEVSQDSRLHLTMNVRSPRAERLNQWVDAVLELDAEQARASLPDAREYPMMLTRSLDVARDWLRDRGRMDDSASPASDSHERTRTGLLVSADARRLRAWGLDGQVLKRERDWAHWFLRPTGDVRGSDQLEVPATNFDCQGLEIDWAGVVWGNDLVPQSQADSWEIRQFKGTRWQQAKGERRRYIVNAYRVILTRARRGQIICVPQPDGRDATLPPEEFDRIADLLMRAGVPSVD